MERLIFMATYSIIHNSGALYLNLKGSTSEGAYVHRPVNLYSSSASKDQQWVIDSFSGVQVIKTIHNETFGLNYRPSSSNCDIQVISGNETDAEVLFHAQSDGTYKIELAHHTGLYLTADSFYRGGTVSWKSARTDRSQNWLIRPFANIAPTKHTVTSGTFAGKNLTILTTDASNIRLVNLCQNVNLADSAYYGLNAGFFNSGIPNDPTVLNVAICDGSVVGPSSTDGINNNNCGAGIIFWNGTNFDVRPVTPGDGYFNSTDHDATEFLGRGVGTWAQGGFSMHLGLSDWYAKLTEEQFGIPNTGIWNAADRYRAGIVVNKVQKTVYLVACTTNATFAQFRSAIQAWLGISDGNSLNGTYSGLFLDGGASTQLKGRQPNGADKFAGGSRKLCQIIALRDNT